MIPQFEPDIGFWDAVAVFRQVLSRDLGPRSVTHKFERKLAEVFGRKHCIATTSGTVALLMALQAAAVKRASKVVFPAYGMIAGANAADFLGHQVVLVDVAEHTMSIHATRLFELEGNFDAVIFINGNGYYGKQVGLAKQFCRERGAVLIEDSSQAIGIQDAGTTGDLTTVSFSVPKLVTTGQGGAVLTDSDILYDRLCRFSDHGGGNWRKTRVHERVGLNLRFNDILATLGLRQLNRLPATVAKRKRVRSWYRESLVIEGKEDAWSVVYRCEHPQRLQTVLAAQGIESSMPYRPNNESAPFRSVGFPNATALADSCLYLPSSIRLTYRQVKRICRIITETPI